MRKESAVLALLALQQREWRVHFPGLLNRAHQAIVGYLCGRARSGAPLRQLYGVTKEVFLLDDATVRERVDEILRLGLCRSDPPGERLSGRSLVIPNPVLLASFDDYLRPIAEQMRLIEPMRALAVPAALDEDDRQAILFAFDTYANAWLAAADRVLAGQGLSPGRRADARRRLPAASYWSLLHLAMEHADAVRAGTAADATLMADQLAASVLEQTGQGFQTIRDHISWLLTQGLLARHSGRGLRVSLAPAAETCFGAALLQGAAAFADAARKLGGDGDSDPGDEDPIEQTVRMPLACLLGGEAAGPRHILEIVHPPEAAQRIPLQEGTLVIGRLPPADVILRDGVVSRAHCRVELSDGVVRVIDLGSTNGTFIDDERIDGTHDLGEGAALRVGPYTLVCRLEEPD
ncbi:MAG: FHA domain-containing protein [Acetobacteraceae bacterium]